MRDINLKYYHIIDTLMEAQFFFRKDFYSSCKIQYHIQYNQKMKKLMSQKHHMFYNWEWDYVGNINSNQ
jgi:hypothetical protein